jgi:[ribosomal protein S5]-alanine N-acetyltransferase
VDDGRRTRLVTLDDVPALAALQRKNRAFLAPYEPVRDESFFTEDGQREVVRTALERHAEGTVRPHVVLDEGGRVVGRVTLNDIVRGPLQSCSLGYWLARDATGRGLATAAVRDMQRVAFDELGLHRIQAGTLVDNVRSQRVLERTGFTRFGLAPGYLHVAGQWRDHVLYQVLRSGPG